MPLEIGDNPSYIDIIRLRLETKVNGSLGDPLYFINVSIWSGITKVFDLGQQPWAEGNGLLVHESTGAFYYDFNPYRWGIKTAGSYTLKWEYLAPDGKHRSSMNFYLEEAPAGKLPKEIREELRQGDLVRVRFSILDSKSNFVDPDTIDRLVFYQKPAQAEVDLESKVIFTLNGGDVTLPIWTKSGAAAGETYPIIRDSLGEFHYDWETKDFTLAPGTILAILYYRLDSSISLVRGDSWELCPVEMVFSPTLRVPTLSADQFERMYNRWIPSILNDQPNLDEHLGPVSTRLIKAYGKAWKELFDWADGLSYFYDPDTLEPRALDALASNIGWKLKGSRPEGWRAQIKKAVDLYTMKGTLAGLRGYIETAGGRLESLVGYWQVSSQHIWTDYFVVDEAFLSSYDLQITKTAYFYHDSLNKNKYMTLSLRRVLGRSQTEVTIRVTRGLFKILGHETKFQTWGVSTGDKIKIWVGNRKASWHTVKEVVSETELLLRERYTGPSSPTANFLISESEYLDLDVSDYLDFQSVGDKITRVHWKATAPILPSLSDEIKFQYQFSALTAEEEVREEEILSLPILDDRDEREIDFPPKNFNSRLLEDPDAVWYYQDPEEKLVEGEKVEGPIGASEVVLAQNPLSHADIIPKPADYTFLPSSKKFVSLYGSFVKKNTLYKFALSGIGGAVEESAWINSSGSGVTKIRATENGVVFQHSGVIQRIWVTYIWLHGQFTPRDRSFMLQRRSLVCPLGVTEVDRVPLGYERTAFPYSEKVYNMDEYNGSLQPSYKPCFISPDFLDHCNCAPTTVVDLSIRTPDLSERTINEYEEIIREAKPFHTRVRSVSYVGQFSDSLIIQERLETSVSFGGSDYLQWSTGSPDRRTGVASNRGEFVYLKSIASGSATSVDPDVYFYSESADFYTAPANVNGILQITSGDVGEYSFKDVKIHSLLMEGLASAPSPGSPQRFSLFNPLGSEIAREGLSTGLAGDLIYGINPYGGVLMRSYSTSSSSGTYLKVQGVDLLSSLGLRIGDYIRRSGKEEFYEIIRFEKDNTGKYSILIIREALDNVDMISFWRCPIKDQIGWFQGSYNILESASLPSSINTQSRYLVSVGNAVEVRGESLSGPFTDGVRRSTLHSPVILENLLLSTPSGYVGSLVQPFSSYGSFRINSLTYSFVTKGRGGTVPSGNCDITPAGSGVSSILLSEKGLTFNFSGGVPTDPIIWYNWREGAFRPVSNLSGQKVEISGLNETSSQSYHFELYELIPTGIMFNPNNYAGPLAPPYSAYGHFTKNGNDYYFVTKAEGGDIGKMSDVYPTGSGVTSIFLSGNSAVFNPNIGINMDAMEFASGSTRGDLGEETLMVHIVPDYPYFIKVEDQNLIGNSYRRIPSSSNIDKMELNMEECLSVNIDDDGNTSTRILFKG